MITNTLNNTGFFSLKLFILFIIQEKIDLTFCNILKPMISFNYELDFKLDDEHLFSDWLSKVISSENEVVKKILINH